MDLKGKYRLRIETCIGTILDVQKKIISDPTAEELVKQFEALKQAVDELDMDYVSEGDIRMVEKATNNILCEFREIFKDEEIGPLYENQWN